MANKKLDKLERYAEARLWNSKLKNPGRRLYTEDIIAELIRYYGLQDDGSRLRRTLRKKVGLARRRVYRKYAALQKNITTWAETLDVPERLAEKWVRGGLVDKKNIDAIACVLKDYQEFLTNNLSHQ